MWLVLITDVHRFAGIVIGPFNRGLSLLLLPLTGLIGVRLLGKFSSGERPNLYPPLLGFVIASLIMVPFALNRGYAWENAQPLIVYYLIALGTILIIEMPAQLLPFITLVFFYQFAWWETHAGKSGFVAWHPTLSNFDGYGPLMVFGLGLLYYFGLATRSRWQRALAFVLAAGAVIGVVASQARGAFLGIVAVMLFIAMRSHHKTKALLALVVGSAVLMTGANLLFPEGAYWQEMKTILTEGKSSGTGEDRWILWSLALRIFQERPVFGVGAGNFGAFASAFFELNDDVGGRYALNPDTLYDRQLHSLYFQILSEFGAVGTFFFVLLVVDFWRRNRRLRSAACIAIWRERTGDRLDLRALSLGLEAAMVGCLVTGAFYAAYLSMNWLYALLTLNLVLHNSILGKATLGTRTTAGARRPKGAQASGHRSGIAAAHQGTQKSPGSRRRYG